MYWSLTIMHWNLTTLYPSSYFDMWLQWTKVSNFTIELKQRHINDRTYICTIRTATSGYTYIRLKFSILHTCHCSIAKVYSIVYLYTLIAN